MVERDGEISMPTDVVTSEWGYIGKMPAKGDFVKGGLSQAFCDRWHDWLQAVVAVSKEQLGEKWCDYFLTSPIWHFALDVSYLEDSTYVGTLIPSVDSSGRYFFFTVVQPVPGKATNYWIHSDWTQESQELALAVLEDDFVFESWNRNLKKSALLLNVSMEDPEVKTLYKSALSTVFSYPDNLKVRSLLNYFVNEQQTTPCYWWTEGSEHIESCMFVTTGLPAIGQFSAMLDGLWQKWNW